MGRVLVAVSLTKLETSTLSMLWLCTFKMTTLDTLFTLSVAFSSSNHMMNRSKLTTTQLILHTLGFHSDIFSKLTFAHTFADIEARHSSLAKSRSQFDNCQMPEPSPLFTDALTINQNTPQNYQNLCFFSFPNGVSNRASCDVFTIFYTSFGTALQLHVD